MTDLPPELRDRAARAAYDRFIGYVMDDRTNDRNFPLVIAAWREVADAVAEVLGEHPTAECNCTGLPQPEGPCAWCDVHGLPSVAWSQGIENGVQQERVLSEMRMSDLRARVERAEAERDEALGLLRELVDLHWRPAIRDDCQADMELDDLRIGAWINARALVERAGPAGAHPAGTGKENRDG